MKGAFVESQLREERGKIARKKESTKGQENHQKEKGE